MELFQIGQRKSNLDQQLQSMENIKVERDLFKHIQEQQEYKYQDLKKHANEFEARSTELQLNKKKSRTYC